MDCKASSQDNITQPNRDSAAFQLTTSQMALKYSAFRF